MGAVFGLEERNKRAVPYRQADLTVSITRLPNYYNSIWNLRNDRAGTMVSGYRIMPAAGDPPHGSHVYGCPLP